VTMSTQHSRRGRLSGPRHIPQLEALENRWCPSCTVKVTGDTLHVTGDNGNNTVSIVDNGALGVVVTCDLMTFPAALGIKHIDVKTKGGDDTVGYTRSAAGGTFTGKLDFHANLGDGNDTFTADLGGNGLAAGADVHFDVHGHKGNDAVTINAAGGTFAGKLDVHADLGDGNGTFTGNLNGASLADGAKVHFDVHGKKGADAVTINAGTAAAPVNIAAGADLHLKVDGGKGDDNIAVAYQGELDGKLDVHLKGKDGNDKVAAGFVLNTGSTGKLKAKVNGDKGDDNLALAVTGPGATTAHIKAVLDGGKGTDTCVATPNVTVKHCP
jgi:hypothetical protein